MMNRYHPNRPWRLQTALNYHADGLIDLALGTSAMLFSALLFFNVGWMIGLGLLAVGIGYIIGKLIITLPRVEQLTVDPLSQESFRWTIYLVFGLVSLIIAFSFIFSVTGIPEQIPRQFVALISIHPDVIFGLSGTLLLSLIAFLNRLDRFHFYALVSLGLTVMNGFYELPIFGLSIVFGSILLLSGMTYLYDFAGRYPPQDLY